MSEIQYIEPQLESNLYSDVCQIIDGGVRSEKTLRHCLRSAETNKDDYTNLPDKKLLSEKLRKAIAIAREHYQKDKEK